MKSKMDVSTFPKRDLVGYGLEWRGIDAPCTNCGGSGYVVYGSTATFWGGIGGCTMTKDVCDKCWGSGDAHRPWPSHKEFSALKEAEKNK